MRIVIGSDNIEQGQQILVAKQIEHIDMTWPC